MVSSGGWGKKNCRKRFHTDALLHYKCFCIFSNNKHHRVKLHVTMSTGPTCGPWSYFRAEFDCLKIFGGPNPDLGPQCRMTRTSCPHPPHTCFLWQEGHPPAGGGGSHWGPWHQHHPRQPTGRWCQNPGPCKAAQQNQLPPRGHRQQKWRSPNPARCFTVPEPTQTVWRGQVHFSP